MENRPDKPGRYWVEFKNEDLQALSFDKDMDAFYCDTDGEGYYKPEEIEDWSGFIAWLGPANPDARKQALEDAAKLCERVRCRQWSPRECAAQIRAQLIRGAGILEAGDWSE